MDRDPSVLNIVAGVVAAVLIAVIMVCGIFRAEPDPQPRNGNRTTTTTSLEPL